MKKYPLLSKLALGGLVLSSLSIGIIGLSQNSIAQNSLTLSNPYQSQYERPDVNSVKASLAPMIKRTLPSVVSIDVKAVETVQQVSPLDAFGDLIPREFRDLLGQGGQTQERNVRAQGSGVIIDAANGYVVTNNHVIDSAKQIEVSLDDKRVFAATVVGTDPDSDLAVLKLQNFTGLRQIGFADSDKVQIGDFVVAIGNPFGIGLTATQGIISALNRSASLNLYDNFIQTDASINSGNSGGALVDLDGNLVGINSAILSRSGGSVGIGFAIPANYVKSIANQIISNGKVSRGVVGIRGSDLNQKLVDTLKIPVTQGAFVSDVEPNSAAAKAGLKAGDVITRFNDIAVVDFNQLRSLVSSVPVNTRINITYIRDGKTYSTTVVPQSRESYVAQQKSGSDKKSSNVKELIALNARFVESNGYLQVAELGGNSLLQQNGIIAGDVLVAINGQSIRTTEQLKSILNDQRINVLVMKFQRSGNRTIYVTIPTN